ncbi:MAG: tetratricopeptide repeat protein [Deltaproteobacteria bacterium]|nr:tetratricopeptide repeat protein [Deltaproteobacteria bacterium]
MNLRSEPSLRRLTTSLCALFLLLGSCATDSPKVDLLPLPSIDLSTLETGVREQIESRQGNLETMIGGEVEGPPLAAAFGELGRTFHAYSLFESAEVCYRNAAALAPEDSTWPYLQGHVALASNRPEEALEGFSRVLEIDPSHVPARIRGAEALGALGREDEARQFLQAALAQDPSSAFAHYRLGQLDLAQNQPTEGVHHLKEALRLQPEATVIYSTLATAYQALGDKEAAQEALELRGTTLVALSDPLMAQVQELAVGVRANMEKGSRAFAARRFQEAETLFRLAVEEDPENATAHLNLGAALVQLGRKEEAEEKIQEALRLDPENARGHFNLGTLFLSEGRDDAGIAELQNALELNPEYSSARFNLANLYLKKGRYQEAEASFHQLVQDQPGNAPSRLGEAIAMALLNRQQEAVERLEAGLQAVPGEASLTNALARLLATSGSETVRDGSRAVELVQELIAAQSNLEHIETLAMALAETGDFATAQEWQERAIQAVRQSSRRDLLAGLEANLALYRQGKPCRTPWRPEVFGAAGS